MVLLSGLQGRDYLKTSISKGVRVPTLTGWSFSAEVQSCVWAWAIPLGIQNISYGNKY